MPCLWAIWWFMWFYCVGSWSVGAGVVDGITSDNVGAGVAEKVPPAWRTDMYIYLTHTNHFLVPIGVAEKQGGRSLIWPTSFFMGAITVFFVKHNTVLHITAY